jgi:FG-GAP repeat protein/trypsin
VRNTSTKPARVAVAALAGLSTLVLFAPQPATAADDFAFVARLTVGVPAADDARACTGVLVRPRVLATATDCLVTTAHPDPAATSGLPITATFPTAGTIRAVDVRTSVAPGVSLVVLAKPAGVTPLAVGGAAAAGEALTAVGFGRTADTWVPAKPRSVAFTAEQASTSAVSLALGATATAGLCRGDAGAPLVRTAGGGYELAGLATAAFQKGCIGSADTSGDASGVPVTALSALPAATVDPFDQLTLSPTDSGTAPRDGVAFGSAVAAADFNKDGWVDVAVGAPGDRTGAAGDVASGTVTVFAGGANGPAKGVRLLQSVFGAADEAGDQFGAALAVGDFNADSWMDLAVGTPGEQIGTIKAGSIAIYFGSATGLATAKGIDQNDLGKTDLAGDLFGTALAAGDFTGDKITDLAVGAPGKVVGGVRTGEVTILKGSTTGLKYASTVDQNTATSGANEAGDLFGAALAAGNVLGATTGTVYADLVVGVPGEAPSTDPQSGMVYVIPGSASGPVTGAVSVTQNGTGTGANEAGDQFGAAVATGDFNKDGWADIAMGVPGEVPRTDPRSGSVTVVPGGASTVGAGYFLEEVSVPGGDNQADDLFGKAFAVGDFNGDTYADLLVGAPGRAGNAGRLYAFTGGAVSTARPSSLTPSAVIRQSDVFDTDESGDRFASALTLADLNKDGKADAVVGNPGEGAPGEPDAGTVVTLSRVTGAT